MAAPCTGAPLGPCALLAGAVLLQTQLPPWPGGQRGGPQAWSSVLSAWVSLTQGQSDTLSPPPPGGGRRGTRAGGLPEGPCSRDCSCSASRKTQGGPAQRWGWLCPCSAAPGSLDPQTAQPRDTCSHASGSPGAWCKPGESGQEHRCGHLSAGQVVPGCLEKPCVRLPFLMALMWLGKVDREPPATPLGGGPPGGTSLSRGMEGAPPQASWAAGGGGVRQGGAGAQWTGSRSLYLQGLEWEAEMPGHGGRGRRPAHSGGH